MQSEKSTPNEEEPSLFDLIEVYCFEKG